MVENQTFGAGVTKKILQYCNDSKISLAIAALLLMKLYLNNNIST